jgi:hypothetical protein
VTVPIYPSGVFLQAKGVGCSSQALRYRWIDLITATTLSEKTGDRYLFPASRRSLAKDAYHRNPRPPPHLLRLPFDYTQGKRSGQAFDCPSIRLPSAEFTLSAAEGLRVNRVNAQGRQDKPARPRRAGSGAGRRGSLPRCFRGAWRPKRDAYYFRAPDIGHDSARELLGGVAEVAGAPAWKAAFLTLSPALLSLQAQRGTFRLVEENVNSPSEFGGNHDEASQQATSHG